MAKIRGMGTRRPERTQMDRGATPNKSFDISTAASWVRGRGVYVAFVVLVIFNLIITPNFASLVTINTLLITVSPIVLVSLGVALTIGTEGIDLSVGSVMALASAFLPLYLGYGWPVAVLVVLLVGALAGLVNGSLVAFVGIQPIIATLALLVGGRGLAQIFAGGQSLPITDPAVLWLGQGRLFGVPAPVIVVVVGGTPLSGGRVKIMGTVMGALLIQLISNTFISNDLPFTWAQVLTAGIILVAVYVQKGRGSA